MLKIGIIGLGPDWDAVYRPALSRLSRRLSVTAVYDAVAPRAARAGEELEAACVSGIRAVLERADVRAVLWLDDAWHGLAPLRLAIEHGKAMYVAAPMRAPVGQLEELSRRAAGESVVISPELPSRTAPATTRVHELAATRLGVVEHVEAQVGVPGGADLSGRAVAAIDWCSALLRSVPTDCRIQQPVSGTVQLDVAFRRSGRDGTPTSAGIRLHSGEPAPSLQARLRCRHGEIELHSETELSWRTADQAEHERLDRERSNVEVLLDHFARRVVGGLVPVAGLDDVCRILQLLQPHQQALHGPIER